MVPEKWGQGRGVLSGQGAPQALFLEASGQVWLSERKTCNYWTRH